mmetsp:Transcript_140930/g.270427  ORF Transcript_140930/g.270427 Transcript_140930/m.270427 type:complete len:541 (-) Transcript_140930:63-1685(-)
MAAPTMCTLALTTTCMAFACLGFRVQIASEHKKGGSPEGQQTSQKVDFKHSHPVRMADPTRSLSRFLLAFNLAAAWHVTGTGKLGRRLEMKTPSVSRVYCSRSCHGIIQRFHHIIGTRHRNKFATGVPLPAHGTTANLRHSPLQMILNASSSAEWLAEVQNEILAEVESERVAKFVELPVMFNDETESNSFDFYRWSQYRSPSRYGRLLPGILFGITSRRIALTVALLVLFSCLVGSYSEQARIFKSLPELELPLTPFELSAPVLGLLLVFRTDAAYERFDRGSDATWELTSGMRSMIRQLALFISGPQMPEPEREAGVELIDACCLLHGWLMQSYLRGDLAAGQTTAWMRLTLGEEAQAQFEARLGHDEKSDSLTATAATSALSLALMRRLPSLDVQERIVIDSQLDGITSSLGTCEKLIRTPIPLGYTRYAVRFLWIWLSLIPFALANTFSTFGDNTWWQDKPKPVLALATAFISFIFLSIEDIAVQIEEPFTILPLEKHQEWLFRETEQIKAMLRVEPVEKTGGKRTPERNTTAVAN